MYKIMSSINRDSFISFSIYPDFSLSCLIALVRTSNTTLNRSGERQQLCLVLDLRGKSFSLSPSNMMLAVGFL